jgi:hypothetical protein
MAGAAMVVAIRAPAAASFTIVMISSSVDGAAQPVVNDESSGPDLTAQ